MNGLPNVGVYRRLWRGWRQRRSLHRLGGGSPARSVYTKTHRSQCQADFESLQAVIYQW